MTVTEAGAEGALTPEAWAREVGLESSEPAERYFAQWILHGDPNDPPPYYSKGAEAFRRWRTESAGGAADHVRRLVDGMPAPAALPPSPPSDVLVAEGLRLVHELLSDLAGSVHVTPGRHDRHSRMLARLEGIVGQLRRALLPDL